MANEPIPVPEELRERWEAGKLSTLLLAPDGVIHVNNFGVPQCMFDEDVEEEGPFLAITVQEFGNVPDSQHCELCQPLIVIDTLRRVLGE